MIIPVLRDPQNATTFTSPENVDINIHFPETQLKTTLD